jgi:hypothetical protein
MTGLSILVVRTGGFAGIRQQWHVEPDGDVEAWVELIRACPWRSVTADPESRDRFVWRIEAELPPRRRSASVPDRELVGPWKVLVERVQQEGQRD